MSIRKIATTAPTLAVLFNASSCSAKVSWWIVASDGAGQFYAQGLCGATVAEVGVVRITGSPEVRTSDYIWRTEVKSNQDRRNIVSLFEENPGYAATPSVDVQLDYPFQVVMDSSYSVRVDESPRFPSIFWNGRSYPSEDLPKIEDEYSRLMFGGRKCG